jgi:hypothetical protein
MSNLMQEAHLAKKERDDALYRLDQVQTQSLQQKWWMAQLT